MKFFGWTHYQAIVGESATWREAAHTLRELAQDNDVAMNKDVYFSNPYLGMKDEMSKLVEDTYRMTRSKYSGTSDIIPAMRELKCVSVRLDEGCLRSMSGRICGNAGGKIGEVEFFFGWKIDWESYVGVRVAKF